MSVKILGWAWEQPISPHAKLALLVLADGGNNIDDIVRLAGLTQSQAIDAVSELGKNLIVMWRDRRPFFRLGEAGFIDQDHRSIDGD